MLTDKQVSFINRMISATMLGFSGNSLADEPVVLRINPIAPPTHYIRAKVVSPWMEDVGEATNGRVKIHFNASRLGAFHRNFDMVWAGILDIGVGNQSAAPGRFQITQINERPFLGTDKVEVLSVALWRTYQKYLYIAEEFKGTHLLSLHVGLSPQLYTVEKPVRTAEDIKGLKIASPSEKGSRLLESMGAVPVLLPITEVYEGIARGIVDGIIIPITGITGKRLTPFIKYETLMTEASISFGGFFLAMNENKWQQLEDQDRQIISSLSGEEYARRTGKVFDEQHRIARKILEKHGVESVIPDETFMNSLREGAIFMGQTWRESALEKGIAADEAVDYFMEQIRIESERLQARTQEE